MAGFWDRVLPGRRSQANERGSAQLGTAPLLVHWLDTTPVDRHDKPCELESLAVQARVRGVHAEVTQTLVLANHNDRPLSVAVGIPLPDQATVTGYALDINGQLVDGVVVPKEQARVAFETEQRRGADPGLVEAVRGNVYRTRVYPVPAHGRRTVRLRYVAPLLLHADGSATLDLPMPAEHLARRNMHISVEQLGTATPQIRGLGGAQVQQSASSWGVDIDERDLKPTEPVRIDLPELPATFVLTERDDEGTVWFCASALAPRSAAGEAAPLTSLTVLWDASGSRASQDLRRELELLQAYADAPSLQQITLVTFADHVLETQRFSRIRELIDHVRKVRYDGGTNLQELAQTVAELDEMQAAQGSACVLFTDGLDTLCNEVPVFDHAHDILAVVSGQERDVESLRQACRGLAFERSQAPQNAQELAAAFAERGCQGLWGLRGQGIADVCDASAPRGGRLVALGKLTTAHTSLTLGDGIEPLMIRADDAREGTLLAGAWAARRVSLLSPRAADNAEELLRLGRRFGVVSPVTSLLVLETLEQWLEYDIEPPRTLPDMHAAWRRIKAGEMRHSSEETEAELHRERLRHQWAEVMRWWRDERVSPISGRRGAAAGPQFCRNCGASVHAGDRFCVICGSLLETPPFSAEDTASFPSFGDFEMIEERSMRPAFEGEPLRREAAPQQPLSMMAAPMAGSASLMADAFFAEDASEAPGEEAPRDHSAMRVRVQPWMPDALYLRELDHRAASGEDKLHKTYFDLRERYQASPSFFLDCAGWFLAHDDRTFGLRVLSNLAELRIEDAALLRVMAWRLREAEALEEALVIFRRVLRLRGEDSQSYRDLALVLAELARAAYEQGNEQLARAYAEEAGELYRKTAFTPWQRRPMSIGLFAVEEYNVFRGWAEAQNWQTKPNLPSLGDGFEGVPDCDLRITLAWDADETDVDIHVTEPSGEEAYYAHRFTAAGGRVSEDITDGYGPELYEIRHAREGDYAIRAHYYASHQQTVFGPATCTLTVYTNWGRPNQTQAITTTRLDREREMIPVGTASYGEATHDEARDPGDAHNEKRDASNVAVGMTVEQVTEIMGAAGEGDPADPNATLQWTLANGHRIMIVFVEGKVVRVLEVMPWGEVSIVAS